MRTELQFGSAAACPLCGARGEARGCVQGRWLLDCSCCGLVYVHPQHHLDAAREQAEYELHQNDSNDAGYRRFLNRLAEPLLARLPRGAVGLDYGCGPGPTLSVMLEEQGLVMRTYDPFFAPNAEALVGEYDFVTCTETAEHFFRPDLEFGRLRRLVRRGGLLAVMTEVLQPERELRSWAYLRDPTHVCFYRWGTLQWIASGFGAELERPHVNVALMQLP